MLGVGRCCCHGALAAAQLLGVQLDQQRAAERVATTWWCAGAADDWTAGACSVPDPLNTPAQATTSTKQDRVQHVIAHTTVSEKPAMHNQVQLA